MTTSYTPEIGADVLVTYAYDGSGVALSYSAEVVAVGEVNVAVKSTTPESHPALGVVDGLTGKVLVPAAGDFAFVPRGNVRAAVTPAPVASFGWLD